MKISLTVSDNNECTQAPYWLIIDPRQLLRADVASVASMISGPFFSREEAEEALELKNHRYSKNAKVYCHSGVAKGTYWSQYAMAFENNEVENDHRSN